VLGEGGGSAFATLAVLLSKGQGLDLQGTTACRKEMSLWLAPPSTPPM